MDFHSPKLSPQEMISCSHYGPVKGPSGTLVAVVIEFKGPKDRVLFIRIVFGSRAVITTLHQLGKKWRCEGIAPQLSRHNTSEKNIPLFIQVVDGVNTVLDSMPVGMFAYSDEERSVQTYIPLERRRQVLRRRDASQEGIMPPVNLKFMSSLADMGQNLTDEERRLGRRLVRFFRKHVGDDLLVSSRPIRQEEYNERLVVISCIYRHETAERWVTSVDIIYLLQYFVQEAFSVEEKNRIRRNLEMFAPITISKTKVEQEHFFKQIMGFPVPRPRHIEKDIKVFKWKKLAPALDKIMQKYSVFTVDIASENATLWPPHQPAPPNLTPPAPAFYDTPQHPSSFPPAPLATFDGAHLSIGSSQLSFAPPTHISPSQLHLQGMIDPTAQGPSDGGDLSGPHMPQPHVAGDDGHDPTYDPGTAFHNVDSLEFQIIHEHNSNDGMPTPQFI